jgi:DNA-binding XRE family transcriptional regulator
MEKEPASSEAEIGPKRKRALPVRLQKRAPDSQPEREIFARNFRMARVEAGLSQRDLAQQTGIAQAHISEVENAMHNIGIDTMVKLAQAVKKPVFELLRP